MNEPPDIAGGHPLKAGTVRVSNHHLSGQNILSVYTEHLYCFVTIQDKSPDGIRPGIKLPGCRSLVKPGQFLFSQPEP